MRQRLHARTIALAVGTLLAFQFSLTAQSPVPHKRPLTYDVVDSWKSIQGTRLSNDGQWLAYALTSQGEDGELIVRDTRSNKEFRHPRGTNPSFTIDGELVVFSIAQPKAEEERENQQRERAEAQRGGEQTPEGRTPPAGRSGQTPSTGSGQGARRNEPRTGMGIMTLATGQVTAMEKVGSFRLPEESAAWLAYYKGIGGAPAAGGGRGGRGAGGRRGAPPQPPQGRGGNTRERRKEPGSDLILRNLATGEETTIPEVTEYIFDKKGTHLAYTVSSNDATKDGAFARRLTDASVTTLHSGRGRYRGIAFDDAGRQLAFLSDQAEFEKPVAPYRVYFWKPGTVAATELVSPATAGMPKGMTVSENGGVRFSVDGSRLYLATATPPPPPPDPNARGPQPIAVDVWSWKDPQLQPMQRVRAEQERQRSYRAVVHLADKKFVQLATPEMPAVNPGDEAAVALGSSDIPYRMEVSWDQSYNDHFVLDLKTGQPKKFLERWPGGVTMSPGGKYAMFFDERAGHWFTYRVADGVRVNLTEKLRVKFQQDNDVPDLPGPYGTGGWTVNDASVLLYDEFDIWDVKPDGTGARNITSGEGRKQRLIFRYRSFDPDERSVPTTTPLFLSATHDVTRATASTRSPASP